MRCHSPTTIYELTRDMPNLQTLQMGQLTFLSVCRIKINGHQAVCLLLSVYKGFL